MDKIPKVILSAALVISLLFLAFLLYNKGDLLSLLLMGFAASAAVVFIVYVYYGRVKIPRRIDELLVSLLIHMHVISLGEVGPDDLVKVIAETEDYGYYSKIFDRIRDVARKFGYGFTKATAKVAAMTKPPFKDVLVRCEQIFSSLDPKGYLELESSTMFEEYSGYYERALKAMETFGGVYSTFQSVSVFIIMIVVLLVVFTGNTDVVYYAYVVTPLTLMAMLVAFISLVPKEKFTYIDKSDPPKLYRLFRAAISIPFACIMPAFIFGSYFGIPYGFAVVGLGVLLPGLIAYRFERLIYKIDENYPTLIKSLGENMASASSLKSALYYVLYLELGPLKKLLKRAYARLELGISNEKTMSLLSAEAASHRVYLVNKMFLDAFTYGANPLEASKVLGNSCVKLLEFRKKRASISKSLEAVVYILQPLTVALVVILGSLSKYFTQSLTSLPFFTFGQIPVEVVEFGNLFLVICITIFNSLVLKFGKGGFWGSIFLYAGILFLLSAAAWIGAEMIMELSFGGIMETFQEII
ncbi:MAG: hypothetical protein QW502_02425 [Candidatus Bathyarchaeia archaeon]|nr:hypothetical protein [Candidatus Bathyarchaeota archaeon]